MGYVFTPKRREGVIQDAIWWFRGFRTARQGEGFNDPTHDLSGSLALVLEDMQRMADGKTRLIGSDDRHLAIAIRENEFECIYDAFHERADAEDIKSAFDTLKRILKEFTAERRRANDPFAEVPF